LFSLGTPVSSTNNTAASIYCKNIPVDRTLSSGGKSTLDAFAAGTQYLILDAGGKNVTI
jgi:hypothetical protein